MRANITTQFCKPLDLNFLCSIPLFRVLRVRSRCASFPVTLAWPFPTRTSKLQQQMASAEARTLGIKQKALVRNIKDLKFCDSDIEKEARRLEAYRANDPERVDQQVKHLAEYEMMVPEYLNRIRRGIEDLKAFLTDDVRAALEGNELIAASDQTLREAEEACKPRS